LKPLCLIAESSADSARRFIACAIGLVADAMRLVGALNRLAVAFRLPYLTFRRQGVRSKRLRLLEIGRVEAGRFSGLANAYLVFLFIESAAREAGFFDFGLSKTTYGIEESLERELLRGTLTPAYVTGSPWSHGRKRTCS